MTTIPNAVLPAKRLVAESAADTSWAASCCASEVPSAMGAGLRTASLPKTFLPANAKVWTDPGGHPRRRDRPAACLRSALNGQVTGAIQQIYWFFVFFLNGQLDHLDYEKVYICASYLRLTCYQLRRSHRPLAGRAASQPPAITYQLSPTSYKLLSFTFHL